LFPYCIFNIYSAIWPSSHKCVINSVFSVQLSAADMALLNTTVILTATIWHSPECTINNTTLQCINWWHAVCMHTDSRYFEHKLHCDKLIYIATLSQIYDQKHAI